MWLPVVTILFYVYKYFVKYLHEQDRLNRMHGRVKAYHPRLILNDENEYLRIRVLFNECEYGVLCKNEKTCFFFSAFIHTDVSVKFPYIYLKAIIFIVKFMDMFVKCNMFIAHYSTSNQFSICYNFLQLLFPIGYFEDQLVQSAFIY